MRILTNITSVPEPWVSSNGARTKVSVASTAWEFLARSTAHDVLLVDCDPRLTLQLCLLLSLFWFRYKPIVAADLVLRRPTDWKSRVRTNLAKLLLRRVDHFINYFKELSSYEKYFGISPNRSSYVRFKSNIKDRYAYRPDPNGKYVLGCFGNSERDFDTFIRAAAKIPYPAAIAKPNLPVLQTHCSRLTIPERQFPSNLQILENDGTIESSIRIIGNAKMVALPTVPDRICASGISTALAAMILGKCVILTEGPGATDVFTNEALFVPVADPDKLADVIRQVWTDDELRERIAKSGQLYAESCGTESDLRQRTLDLLVSRYGP